ncbi:hypothetical protein Pelo_1209 [Pelomyxa schiedti]|nr:hypothetical protein Pelo_1209 [Pelomyxa schiedti]
MAQAEARHQMRSEDGDAFILSKKIMQLEREKLSMSMELQDVQAVLDDLEPSVQQLTVMQQKLEETQRLLAAELLRKEELTNTLQQYESSDSENEDISENETDPQSQLAGIQSETEALTRERDQLLHQLQQQQNQPPLSKLSS